jgi:amphi-Trp domain-containing protein
MSKKDVSLKGTVALKDVVDHLENLVACLKAGKVCIQNCNDHVTLEPQDLIKFEVSAGQRESKESLSLKLTWHKDVPDDNKLELRITTEEPPKAKDDADTDTFSAETISAGTVSADDASEPH